MRVIGGEEHTVFFDLYRTVLDMTLEYRLLKKQLNMPTLRSPYIRIKISEIVETLGSANRESSFVLETKEFQTRADALEWMNSQRSIRSFGEDVADAIEVT